MNTIGTALSGLSNATQQFNAAGSRIAQGDIEAEAIVDSKIAQRNVEAQLVNVRAALETEEAALDILA